MAASSGDPSLVPISFALSDAQMDAAELDELDEEDEIDQLESDGERDEQDNLEEDPAEAAGPLHRVPGQTLIPSERLEAMLRADGSAGAMSKEALFLISVAAEDFIKRLADCGIKGTNSDRRSTLGYHELASAAQQYQELMFLQDTIPTALPLSEALRRRAAKAIEVLQADPSLAPPTALPSFTFATSNVSGSGSASAPGGASSRARARSTRSMNGTNGTASARDSPAVADADLATGRRSRHRDAKGRRRQVVGQNGEDDDDDEDEDEDDGGAYPARGQSASSGAPTRASRRTSRPSREARAAARSASASASAHDAPEPYRGPRTNGVHDDASPAYSHTPALGRMSIPAPPWSAHTMPPPPAPPGAYEDHEQAIDVDDEMEQEQDYDPNHERDRWANGHAHAHEPHAEDEEEQDESWLARQQQAQSDPPPPSASYTLRYAGNPRGFLRGGRRVTYEAAPNYGRTIYSQR